ncbi:T9SS type A sorting domain-containing protein [Flavobacteriaceae bacterium TP-CH-4]|uniref:T9SS type A sorting domain-containing protein n=1 Tax=Pelagihabitans pacificus TaxID=2696054 RepID=A0A967AYF0_9FLAO|nr:T9SS type A sorting domain-containing protein [Pelagihabitans pacificus]NHF58856.1 T9SS type A sorting domain-containing protein [Pelagihabitans pacificus]
METLLPRKIFNLFLAFGLMCLLAFNTNAQELKTTHEDAPQKGHALYKQSKIYDSKTGPTGEKPKAVGDRAIDRWKFEQKQLRNPYTKTIPKDIKQLEAKFSDNIKERSLESEATNKSSETFAKSKFQYWKNRGPGNVGGRTRALALDMRNENIVFAGGVSGGLWRSTNLGQSWRKVTLPFQSPSITSIVQDPRQGHRNVWYYASGERFGNSAFAPGAFYTGTGVYKSVNNGRTWFRLTNSNDNDLTSITSLDIINSIAIDPKNGDVYAATFEGLFRSQDGGQNFNLVLPSARDSQTEVMITPEGKIYATVDIFSGPDAGFFVSDNGDEWTPITPEGIIPAYGRTVMAYDPSDENRIYFFSFNLADFSEAFLWRYQADAETPEEEWVDLSANLPVAIGGRAGNLNLQGAYNMIIKVHPTKPDLVFLGGTNLYRSTTGFTTPTGFEGWIGGYTNLSDSFALYPNHHPDQHNLVFLPSNPDRAISANDGGVQLTEDITDTENFVAWTSLNNKYITTQPYAISFDPEGNSDDLLAGFQDNGTWFTDSKNINDPWIDDFGGDGSYNAIADGGRTRYVSSQFGNVYRLNFDEAGEFESFTRITPAGASNFDFVAPFLLDPINDNIMYMPAGDRMWRNNNLDEVPLFSNAPASVNWVELKETITPDGSFITAMDVSKFPVASRLYYGTDSGKVFRMDNSNVDGQKAVDISTGKGLPEGNVNSVYVDPKNSDRVFIVFSNYGIPSVFVSRDAGESWRDISGNLEENRDGSGNGPSVRWFAMNGNNDGYFVGTSTGLYFTYRLQGKNTQWFREPIRIGNGVVVQVKTRADGFVAAGVHGNGVYSANFYVRPRPEPTLSVARLLPDLTVPIDSDPIEVDIKDLFVSSKGKKPKVTFRVINPDVVESFSIRSNKLIIEIKPGVEGSSVVELTAKQGREQVSEGFTINVIEPAIYEQTGPVSSSSPSQNFLDFGGAIAQSADDFVIPEGSTWKIRNIIANGAVNGAPAITDATVVIYTDNNGLPGQEIYNSGSIVPDSEPTDYNLNLPLPEEVELTGGAYWLSVYTNLAFDGGNQWFWFTQAQVIGNEAAFKDAANLFGLGAIDWTPQSVAFTAPPEDQVFQIFGMVQEAAAAEADPASRVAEDGLESQSLVEVEGNVVTTVWPNPSTSEFFFSLKDNADARVTTRVYNMLGQLVYEKADIDAKQTFSWDASAAPTGLYIVKITGKNTNKSFNIVKK